MLKLPLGEILRLSDVIGEEEQKDPFPNRLSFLSLNRQIDAGMKKRYKERVILRNHERALAKLRQMLRDHYKQKSGTELYQELTTMCQSSKETPLATGPLCLFVVVVFFCITS